MSQGFHVFQILILFYFCIWVDFSSTCGDGKRSRTRTILTLASGNGADCIGDATEQEACNNGECPGWRNITDYNL